MIRPIRTVLAIAFLAAGAALGALNPVPVSVDLGVVRFEAALGVVMLVALLLGVLIGGLALTVSVVLPMRHRSRRDRKSDAQAITPSLSKGQAVVRPEGLRSTAPGDVEHELRQ
jgi:lipopolysaccharide assembly protein A